MRAEWAIKPLGDLCKTGAGGTPLKSRKEYYEGGDIPWLLSGEVSQGEISEATNFITQKGLEDSSAKLFPSNTVLVAMYGATAGQVGILRFEASTNQAVCGIFPNEHFVPEFLFYFFLHKKDELVAQAAGNAQPNISQIKIRNTGVPVAPLPEQHRIVAILDEAFDGIATAKANAEKNLQNARALFESHLQAVFSERGEGWVEKPLGEVADLLDCLHKTPTYAETGFPMVRVTDIKPGFLDLSNTRKVDEQTFIQFSKNYVPKVGDIVFSRVGSCGVSALVNSAAPFCLGQNTVFILPKMDSMLLYHFLNSPKAKAQFEGFIDGTTQPTISMKSIRQVTVPIAPLVEHDRIVAYLDSLREETQRLESIYQKKLTALDDLKKSLLHQAFSGQL